MPIRVVDNRSKLKKRQSYRSQRPDRDLNELRRLRMVRERAGQETDRLTNEDIEELKNMRKDRPDYTTEELKKMRMARPGYSGMKYGGMKKKTKKMKTGGMSKARGTGCAIRGTNFKGIF